MQRFAIVLAAIMFAVPANSKSIYDIDPQMRKDAQCMFGVLKRTPGIDQVKLGAWKRDAWVYPYLEYRSASDKQGYRQFVRFAPISPCSSEDRVKGCVPYFDTVMSGLMPAGRAPEDWGASAIIDRWKSQCRVDAAILFE